MSKQKMTEWFPPEVSPARPGVYLTRALGLDHDGVLRHWNGVSWSFMSDYSETAPLIKPREWRGLAENPNA